MSKQNTPKIIVADSTDPFGILDTAADPFGIAANAGVKVEPKPKLTGTFTATYGDSVEYGNGSITINPTPYYSNFTISGVINKALAQRIKVEERRPKAWLPSEGLRTLHPIEVIGE